METVGRGTGVYRAAVRWFVRRQFAHLNANRLDRFMSVFDETSTFLLAGEHELGGVRCGRAEIQTVLEQMRRHFPHLVVTPVTVVASGWPWDTVVATRLEIRGTLVDGTAYLNHGLQMASVRWGHVVEDRIYEDVDLLRAALAGSRS